MKGFYEGYIIVTYLSGFGFIMTGWAVLYWLFIFLFTFWAVTLCWGLYLLKRETK